MPSSISTAGGETSGYGTTDGRVGSGDQTVGRGTNIPGRNRALNCKEQKGGRLVRCQVIEISPSNARVSKLMEAVSARGSLLV